LLAAGPIILTRVRTCDEFAWQNGPIPVPVTHDVAGGQQAKRLPWAAWAGPPLLRVGPCVRATPKARTEAVCTCGMATLL